MTHPKFGNAFRRATHVRCHGGVEDGNHGMERLDGRKGRKGEWKRSGRGQRTYAMTNSGFLSNAARMMCHIVRRENSLSPGCVDM